MNAASPDEAGEVRWAGVMLRDASAGLILALVTFAYSLSFGALIFAGRLSEFAAAGVAAATLSAGLASLVLSRLSSFPRALGGPDTPVVAVAAALAAGVAAATPAEATAMQTLANVAAALVLSTAATAALLLSAGAYGLASFVRFTPFPVVAGFLAASGWFLVVGAASLASGLSGQALWARLAEGGPPPTVLAALIFGAAIAAARVLSGSSLAAPLMVFGAGGAIVAAGPLGLVPPDLLREAGWLLPSTPAGGPALPIAAFVEVAPDPQVLLIFAPEILAVAGVAAIAILLNAAGLEAHARADLEADREFIASGAANAALLPLGGIASNLSLNRSALNTDLGARGRAAGGLAGLVCCALAFAGPWAGALAPTPILAGMVLYMGVGMLRRWLWDAARRFTFSEYLLVLAIFALIVRYGYLAGVTLGLVAACVSFALACARAPFVRQALTRRDYGSFVDRPTEHERLLRAEGERIRIFRLQGFLFFGVSARIADQVRGALAEGEAEGRPVSAVLLDFRAVTGADSTARFGIFRLAERCAADGVRLIFTGFPREGTRLRVLGPELAEAEVFQTLEQGLEACEDALLDALGADRAGRAEIVGWLAEEMPGSAADALVARLARTEMPAGEAVCLQGAPSDAMFFIASGRVSIFFQGPEGPPLRLRTALGRTVVGEAGFFTGAARGASVIAEERTEVWTLTREALDALKVEAPSAALALEELVIRTLADRLSFANREVAALQ